MRRWGISLSTLLVVFLLGATAAHAETEPNDDITEAGILTPAATETGALTTPQDVDWYSLQLGSQQQITLTASTLNAKQCSSGPEFGLLTYWGEEVHSLRPWEPSASAEMETLEYHYTTPVGGGTFYIRVSAFDEEAGPEGCKYQFSVTPASAYVAPPPQLPIVPVPEPNELQAQAFGPLMAGSLYTGSIETSNDKDWLYYYGRASSTVTIVVNRVKCGTGHVSFGVFREGKDGSIAGNSSHEYEGHFKRSVAVGPKSTKFYVEVEGDLGCYWQLEVSPPEALMTALSEPHQKADPCLAAKRRLGRRRARLHRVERALRFARTPRARGILHHKIEARKRAVRAARHSVHVHCG
jgi:hypothetical protein